MISKKEFTEKVEKLIQGNRCDVISAVLKVCEENNVEPEVQRDCCPHHSRIN